MVDFLEKNETFKKKNLLQIKKGSYICPPKERKLLFKRESSSAGRAQPCQGWGRGFESRLSLTKASAFPEAFFAKEQSVSDWTVFHLAKLDLIHIKIYIGFFKRKILIMNNLC